MLRRPHRVPKISGFSLVEVLVSIAIFALGLLGLGMMQVVANRYLNQSNWAYLALVQATDMAERMRANPEGVKAGAYDAITGPGTAVNCEVTLCNPSQLALADAYAWSLKNAQILPSGQGTVTKQGNYFVIHLQWLVSDWRGQAEQIRHFNLVTIPA